ncbi:ATP-binding protein [Vibrio barjaei]|uniref:ATP-binding protein n=1 Tax=Vibrio barjaei TaxID=1676683 RepID=UPI00228364C7|nr:ATP-binding protein [Vibrio barjaei]MCY9872942.1 ATP-binding protein [Vibrio barjaei]
MEYLNFEAGEGLIDIAVRSQNGTTSTAITELISNSFDGNAENIDVTITDSYVEIIDNGEGFQGRDQVIERFKTFGEGVERQIGTFHIGRAQIIGLGKCVWRSSNLAIHTDYNHSKGFTLEENLKEIQGCTVRCDFYEELTQHRLHTLIRDVQRNVRFLDTNVSVNGHKERSASLINWDIDTPEYQISFDCAGYELNVHSMGVFVKSLSKSIYGFTAIINTKKPLKLNVARNQMSDTDPLWIAIDDILRSESQKRKKSESKGRMSSTMIQSVANDIQNYAWNEDYVNMRLFTDINNRRHRIHDLSRLGVTGDIQTLKTYSPLAEMVNSTGAAIVLNQETLQHWNCTNANELIDTLKKTLESSVPFFGKDTASRALNDVQYHELSKLVTTVDTVTEFIKPNTLTDKQKVGLDALRACSSLMSDYINTFDTGFKNIPSESNPFRSINVVKRFGIEAMTNSKDQIWVTEELLNSTTRSEHDMTHAILVVLHELAHDKSNIESNLHNESFYRTFHDRLLETNILTSALNAAKKAAAKGFINKRINVPTWLSDSDNRHKVKFSLNSPLNKNQISFFESLNITIATKGKSPTLLIPDSLPFPTNKQLRLVAGDEFRYLTRNELKEITTKRCSLTELNTAEQVKKHNKTLAEHDNALLNHIGFEVSSDRESALQALTTFQFDETKIDKIEIIASILGKNLKYYTLSFKDEYTVIANSETGLNLHKARETLFFAETQAKTKQAADQHLEFPEVRMKSVLDNIKSLIKTLPKEEQAEALANIKRQSFTV